MRLAFLISKYAGIPVNYIEKEMPWDRLVIYLAIALEQQEQDMFRVWIMAQQDPKKFKWTFRGSTRTRPLQPNEIGERVTRFAKERFGAQPRRGDIWHYAQAKGLSPVFKITRDGKEIFVDHMGNEVKVPQGHFFIPSRHPEAQKLAEEMREN